MTRPGGPIGARYMIVVMAVMCLALPLSLEARHGDGDNDVDRVGIFQSITVSEEHPAGDVVCAFCSIRVDGDVRGDMAVLFSEVNVGAGRTVSGDVATLFSKLTVGEGARINGDLATAMGTTQIDESAHVGGDRAIFASGLGLGVLLAPLLIAVGLLWLLIWGLRRMFA